MCFPFLFLQFENININQYPKKSEYKLKFVTNIATLPQIFGTNKYKETKLFYDFKIYLSAVV